MIRLSKNELHDFLNEKFIFYNQPSFIESDPICIPHQFSKKEDIEITGFLTATIAWGKRVSIINNATKMVKIMGNNPYDFLTAANEKQMMRFHSFVHRTFNGTDALFFIQSLKNIYINHGGLEQAFQHKINKNTIHLCEAIGNFRSLFFSIPYPDRTTKHLSDPLKNSAAKRLCMFLRWMIRKDKQGVDFGIWNNSLIQPKHLMCPLDVHSGNVARKLGLLNRSQNDWKAVEELTRNLRKFDAADPVKYDFALFGLGVFEGF